MSFNPLTFNAHSRFIRSWGGGVESNVPLGRIPGMITGGRAGNDTVTVTFGASGDSGTRTLLAHNKSTGQTVTVQGDGFSDLKVQIGAKYGEEVVVKVLNSWNGLIEEKTLPGHLSMF